MHIKILSPELLEQVHPAAQKPNTLNLDLVN
jgi:hypothetical protein